MKHYIAFLRFAIALAIVRIVAVIQKIAEALHGPEESLTRCLEIYRQKLAIDGIVSSGSRWVWISIASG